MTHTSNIPICRMNSRIFAVIDFNILLPDTGYIFPLTIQGRIPDERGENRLRPTAPAFAATRIPKAGCPLSRKLPRLILLLLGSVHRHGVLGMEHPQRQGGRQDSYPMECPCQAGQMETGPRGKEKTCGSFSTLAIPNPRFRD